MPNKLKQTDLIKALVHNTEQFRKLVSMSDADFEVEAKFLREQGASDKIERTLNMIIEPTILEYVAMALELRHTENPYNPPRKFSSYPEKDGTDAKI